MTRSVTGRVRGAAVILAMALIAVASPTLAQAPSDSTALPMADSAGALARAAQNPIAAMISLPMQNNTNFNYGPNSHTQNVLNIQPVVPLTLTDNWNVITRTILPLISQPAMNAGDGTTFGLGGTQFSAFLSPSQAQNGIIWGAGAVVQAPTTTDNALGSNVWGGGPTFVALTMKGPWVAGGLINNIWSFGGGPRTSYNTMTLQPFINYNFPKSPGTYVSFSPLVTANWEASGDQQWTVPIGLGVGQILRIGQQPVNMQLGGYYNAIRPDIGPEWQVRAQLTLLFPR